MPRLSRQDRSRAREIVGILETVHDGAPPVLETLMPALRRYLGVEWSWSYGVRLDPEGCDLAFGFPDGLPKPTPKVLSGVRRWIRASRRRFGLFDAARVDRGQRNRALALPDAMTLLERPDHGIEQPEVLLQFFREIGADRQTECRALICDGSRLLAWVGGMQADPVEPVQVRRLSALVPPLRRRLLLDDRLASSAVNAAALAAVLDRFPGEAYVVSGAQVHLANAAGRARYDADRKGTGTALRAAIQVGGTSAYEVATLAVATGPTCHLVLSRGAPRDPATVVSAATRRYRLSPREAEVLLHLVQGATNRGIAFALGCAERAVEVHVAHLLDKVGVPSRSALVARVWQTG